MKTIIKLGLCLCIILAYQCRQTAEDHSYLVGTYHWNEPWGKYTPNQDRDNSIVLLQNRGKMKGFYYGTTDEFDQAREGYYPGYFVLKMDSLVIEGDSIWFVLTTTAADIFEKPIDTSIRSTQEALKKGYAHLENFDGWFLSPLSKKYSGCIIDSIKIYFEPDDTGMPEKEFLKIGD